jgi:hypothetical protein
MGKSTRLRRLACIALPLLAVHAAGQKRPSAAARGLVLDTAAASRGYTLLAPLASSTTYLVDLQGQLIHSWKSKYVPGQAAYLLDDGSLLRAARVPKNGHFGGGGIGGRVERIAADGKLLWAFVYADQRHCQHHDIKPLPNGHVLMIAWEKKARDEVLAAGRDPEQMTGKELWPDCVVEVEPQGAAGGKIVWEWHVWDHLVQDVDENKPNFAIVAEHPELVDLNYRQRMPRDTPAEMRRLRSLGYVGGAAPEAGERPDQPPPPFPPGLGPGGVDPRADWCHTNAVDYDPQLDQIALSVHNFDEVWIIDHSTSTAEAAGHSGGRYGKGGDLLYRWGNPRAYGAGEASDQMFFGQHDVRWIPAGSPGSGHLMVFNNGVGRPGGPYSSVVEFAPPVDGAGNYRLERGRAYGPAKACWEYTAPNKADMFSHSISGAERLSNGNTLICSGEQGHIVEVNALGKTVWEYINPYVEHNGPDDGPPLGPPPGPPPWGCGRPPPGLGRGGPPGGPMGGLFRATRLSPDHPGVRALKEVTK